MNKITNKVFVPVFIILFAVMVLVVFVLKTTSGTATIVVIREGNKIIEEIRFKDVSEPREITLSGNTVLVEKDGVSMKYADCPDKCCVNMGKITKSNESIICLPNKVFVEIRGIRNTDLDAVAGAR